MPKRNKKKLILTKIKFDLKLFRREWAEISYSDNSLLLVIIRTSKKRTSAGFFELFFQGAMVMAYIRYYVDEKYPGTIIFNNNVNVCDDNEGHHIPRTRSTVYSTAIPNRKSLTVVKVHIIVVFWVW